MSVVSLELYLKPLGTVRTIYKLRNEYLGLYLSLDMN